MKPKYIEVTFIKPHPKYAYSSRDSGIVDIRQISKMVQKGFVKVEFKKTVRRIYNSLLNRLNIKKKS
jgi:hypothetical protein